MYAWCYTAVLKVLCNRLYNLLCDKEKYLPRKITVEVKVEKPAMVGDVLGDHSFEARISTVLFTAALNDA